MTIQLKSKQTAVLVTLFTTLCLVLAATFAWNSFNQQRINVFKTAVVPGVNLHDDFDGSINKDVYVENSGDITAFVRVRLTEYLETVGQGSLVAGHIRGDEQTETDVARLSWSPHNADSGVDSCALTLDDAISDAWPANANFHDYYNWTMGGQKWYIPALLQHPDTALTDEPDVCSDAGEHNSSTPDAKETMWAEVITMAEWLNGTREISDENSGYWVIDTDGWCYWSKPLLPGQATGLLLDKVERTDKEFGSNVEYCINVWLQAADEMDVDYFAVPENGGITESGMLLVQAISARAVSDADGALFENNRDGTFIQIADKDGNTVQDARAFVPLGAYNNAPAAEKVNTPAEYRLEIGTKVDITDLLWDGEAYINYDILNTNAPFYNMEVTDGGQFTVVGTEIGRDGNVYLRLEDSAGNSLYLASVLADGGSYRQGYPGTGPFGFIWPGSAGLGSGSFERRDPDIPIQRRYFHHIGNGVFVEVADENGTEAIDAPDTTYYFSSAIYGDDPYEINNLDGHSADAKIDAMFSFTLQIGEQFGVLDDKDTGYSAILKGAEMDAAKALGEENGGISTIFTMVELFELNDTLYIDLTQAYANLYLAGMGENGEFGGLYSGETSEIKDGEMKPAVVANKADGEGTSEDPFRIRSRKDMNWVTREAAHGNMFEGQHLVVETSFSMGGTDFLPIGSEAKPFKGTFDGDGFTISDLKITGSASAVGLFSYIGGGGTVKNLTLANVSVNITGTSVGGLAGRNEGTIQSCQIASGSITASGGNVGGIAGYNTGMVTGCINAARVTGNNPTGGVVGQNSGTVTGCENSGAVENKAGSNTGGVVGHNGFAAVLTAAVINSKNIGSVAGANYTGGIVGHTYGNVIGCENSGPVSGGQIVGGVVGQISAAGARVENCKNLSGGTVTGTSNHIGGIVGFNTGGTVNSCINSAKVTGNQSTGGIVGNSQGAVIGCDNSGAVEGASYYTGGIAGSISTANARVESCKNLSGGTVTGKANTTAGIVGQANAGIVIGCENSDNINGTGNVGGIVGNNQTNATVENCKNLSGGVVTGTGNSIGGVIGLNNGGAVKNCENAGTVSGASYVGGVAGSNGGTITGCKNLSGSTVTGTGANIGGVVGRNTATVANCINDSVITAAVNYVGGVAGYNELGTITGSKNNGTINGAGYSGGVAGFNTGTVIACENNAPVNGGGGIGGIVGQNGNTDAKVENCHNRSGGTVTSAGTTNNVGGVVGYNTYGTVKDCTNAGVVTGSSDTSNGHRIGGVVGHSRYASAKIENCQNLSGGTVNGYNAFTGGVTGFNELGTVTGSANSAAVKGNTNTGGVAGQNSGTVQTSYNTGAVSGNSSVGGVAGNNAAAGMVQTSQNTGIVTGSGQRVGGVAGGNYGTVQRCYHNNSTANGVKGTDIYVGGVVGGNCGSITNSYAWGNVGGKGYVGGVIGGQWNAAASTTYSYHAKGSIAATDQIAGGVCGYHEAGSLTNCVAYGSPVSAPNGYRNKVVGQAYGGTRSLCYTSSALTITSGANSGWAGNGNLTAATQAAWSTASPNPGFSFAAAAWRWDSANSLPVLQGVTP